MPAGHADDGGYSITGSDQVRCVAVAELAVSHDSRKPVIDGRRSE